MLSLEHQWILVSTAVAQTSSILKNFFHASGDNLKRQIILNELDVSQCLSAVDSDCRLPMLFLHTENLREN